MPRRRADVIGDMMWSPPADVRDTTEIGRYLRWLAAERGLDLEGFDALWNWSVTDLSGFWSSVWDFFEVRADSPAQQVLADRSMPGARWFSGARLNYAEHLFRGDPAQSVVLARSQTRGPIELTRGELVKQVGRARAGLRRLGVGPGDRVVGYLPNIPETLVAFAAAASLGAVWASCAPELGVRSVVDRFGQIAPTVLLAVTGYTHRDRTIDRAEDVATIRAGLPSLKHVVHVPYGGTELPDSVVWSELLAHAASPAFDSVPFDHPLCVLFSSGTTGPPKPIVHGHGGLLLEHLKSNALQWDLRAGSRLLWPTTTTWMMWNTLVSALLVGASIVLVDGDPGWPDLGEVWRLAADTRASFLGVSPALLMACRKAGLDPGRELDLRSVQSVGTAGSPLPAEGFRYVYEQLGPRVLLLNTSGGTDVCTGIVGGSPLQPVYEGEIAGRCLGVAATAFDDEGVELVDELGELVITEPMPSMPVGFWDDADGSRYRATYFDRYPGVWRHGDWVRFTERGSCVVTGRSDATLNRGGVRLGTGELYTVVQEFDEIVDSLVVHLEDAEGGPGELVLFVVAAPGTALTDTLRSRLSAALRSELSPRHVPDTITAVPAIPRTMTGKKLETPVKRILQGKPADQVASRGALLDPFALDAFVAFSAGRFHPHYEASHQEAPGGVR
jgi:acetoacetyl-CoA synthetase